MNADSTPSARDAGGDRNPLAADLDLDHAASAYDIPAGDIASVTDRGRRLSARRRNGVVIATVLALVATGAGAQVLLANDGDGAREIPLATEGGVVRGDTGITWRVTTPKEGLGGLGTVEGPIGDGPLYALSTAPGERSSAKVRMNGVVWRSADGVDWTEASRVDSDVHFADLAASDGRIYAVGTTAGTAATGTSSSAARSAYDLVAGWSDDDGATFNRTALPLDLRALAANGTMVRVNGARVASGPKGTLIAVTLAASLDVRRLLPDGEDAPNGWVITGTGVDVLGDERNGCDAELEKLEQMESVGDLTGFTCPRGGQGDGALTAQEIFGVTGSYTFDQLGIEGDLLDAVRRQIAVFHAAPGATEFERVQSPSTKAVYGPAYVEAHDGGFEVIASSEAEASGGPQGIVHLHSGDGRSFGQASTLPDLAWVTAVGRVQGATTIVGGTIDRGSMVVRSTGDGGWTSAPLAAAVDPAVVDGKRVEAFVAGIGDFGIVVSALVIDDRRDGGRLEETRVLVSRDGVRWSDTPLRDIVGDRTVRGISRIVVTSNRTVITVATGECGGGCDGPTEQVAAIGVST